jgi:hypothetical protein
MFENAVAISEMTVFIAQDFFFFRYEIYPFYLVNDILGFFAIGADIADGSRTNLSGDQDKIFSACISGR